MLTVIFRVDLLLRIAWEEQMLLRNTCAKRVDKLHYIKPGLEAKPQLHWPKLGPEHGYA
jgi:hypothetical protein